MRLEAFRTSKNLASLTDYPHVVICQDIGCPVKLVAALIDLRTTCLLLRFNFYYYRANSFFVMDDDTVTGGTGCYAESKEMRLSLMKATLAAISVKHLYHASTAKGNAPGFVCLLSLPFLAPNYCKNKRRYPTKTSSYLFQFPRSSSNCHHSCLGCWMTSWKWNEFTETSCRSN